MLALILPPTLFLANTVPDARYGLNRFTAYALINTVLHQATDFDRDGHSWFSAQIDRQPFDASRHPLALDIPGNGVDEDGFGGDFVFTPSPPPSTLVLPARPRHLVIVVLESVRGDVIGKRVNGRIVAPNLEALARSGSYFPEAYSHVGFTVASLKSLFSGKLDPLAGDPSLFGDLKARGYAIGVFSGQPESFGDIDATVGMSRASDVFVDAETLKTERAFGSAAKGSLRVDEAKLLAEFDRRFATKADWARPHFVYFNFQAPHFPYHHPGLPDMLGIDPLPRSALSPENRERVAETYWNAVAYADRQLGAVVARLKALSVWDDTLLVVTADHGESLFDDDFLGHGHVINRQQTHIPLVLSTPGLTSPGPIGLKEFRALILSALGGTSVRGGGAPAFMHIGPLDEPAAIGMAEPGRRFTTLAFDTEDVWFSDTGLRVRYGGLDAAGRKRADRLVNEWARQRWLRRLDARR